MTPEAPRRFKMPAEQLDLPPGISIADWENERTRWQNPRIRAFLSCIRLLDGVLESNYAIFHSSPERLLEIWRKVRVVANAMRTQLTLLVRVPSVLPKLEEARHLVEMAADMQSRTVLSELDAFPEILPEGRLLELRKLLCVSIGQMHAFLTDSFGRLVAADPRSTHDSDYYLSRRFPRDIEEAEWLRFSVARLQRYLVETIEPRRPACVADVAAALESGNRPHSVAWANTEVFLKELVDLLAPRLKELLALRGIRFDEMEIVDHYAVEVPACCRMAIELHAAALEAGDGPAMPILARRAAKQLGEVDRYLRDLLAFVPLWLAGIEERRALLLVRGAADLGESAAPPPARDPRPWDWEDEVQRAGQ